MSKGLAFNDISLIPAKFTGVRSRKDVSTAATLCGSIYDIPVISSNMDSVYSPTLAKELAKAGGVSCVHRFCTIEENVKLFVDGIYLEETRIVKPWVSVGLGEEEFKRAEALYKAGAEVVVIDVANAATLGTVEQFLLLSKMFPYVVVGNFATSEQIVEFVSRSRKAPSMVKVSLGSGSACTTRLKTGVGIPSVTTIVDCVKLGIPVIFDGGVTGSGDLSKALALGASAVMCGRLFSGCFESGARMVETSAGTRKVYRGSASAESYKVQGKLAPFRTAEGESYEIPVTGTVVTLVEDLSGGLRSSMSYLNSINLESFRLNCRYMEISTNSVIENGAHGKGHNV